MWHIGAVSNGHAVVPRDGVADRESQAGSIVVSEEERVKYPARSLGAGAYPESATRTSQ